MEIGLIILAVAVVAAAAIFAFARPKAAPETIPELRADPRLDTVIAGQGAIAGQFQATLEAQAQLSRSLAERIEALDKRLGENLKESASKTGETLGGIQARLTVIDEAQKNISDLSGQVCRLQHVLSEQAGARRLRPGADGKHRARRTAAIALRFPVHPYQPQPARLCHPHSRQRRRCW